MLNKILTAAAIPARAARYPDPPELHAVTFDEIDTVGPDLGPPLQINHDCTVELYAPSIESGDEALLRLGAQLDANNIRYIAQGWHWLSSIRRYQNVIEFSHIEKRRKTNA